jgi:hypothetical protein
MGLGWQMFPSGVIGGFERVIDIGTPIIKNLTFRPYSVIEIYKWR